ncbi:flagellar filament capping protein FliD [Alkalicoccus urumqiensis]|uniref:Flagellar hook-associated protein 2 n=1 Tax=Alkalicoccus urumqiensis TaxID=1548213 RepID=A0A2P6MH81_ALKUR|nr:flagellar filament capping protein FliD [Alkalicoccus urumqiensis]PRO65631.1 flagellar capping protein [Alkalicoccus urumqiensis]
MRLSGFATGMDINQMVKDLMQAERLPMNKMEQQKIRAEWKMDGYREINTKLDSFRTSIFDSVLRRSNMLANKASSSNSSLVTASATAASDTASLRFTEVQSLASAASNASTERISSGTKINASGKLGDQSFAAAEDDVWTKGFVNRQTITVNQSQSRLSLNEELGNPDSIVVRVNGQSYKVVEGLQQGDLKATQVMLDTETNELVFGSDLPANAKVEVTALTADEAGDSRFSLNTMTTFDAKGNEITDTFVVTSDQSMNDVLKLINRSPAGVSTFFDDGSDRVSIIRRDSGIHVPEGETGAEMRFSGGFLEHALKLDDSAETAAENAVFTVNGLTTERRSNTFDINGVQVTLQDTFSGKNVQLGVSRDTDKIMETITSFVEEYNSLIELINGKVGEEHYRDYAPLTEEQRRELSEREAELWDEKAMSGLLRNDSLLRRGVTDFRQQLYGRVDGDGSSAFVQLTQIGITTTRNFRDGGKLEINEDRLRQAIETDAEGVFQLFAADGAQTAEKGIARRVRDRADAMIESISQRAGGMRGRTVNQQFTLGREINNIEEQMNRFERRLKQVEERYWSQFTAMEKAVAQANSQAELFYAQMFSMQ